MAFSRGSINPGAAAGNNAHLRAAIQKFNQDIEELKKHVGAVAVDFDKRTPVATPPGLAKFAVNPLPGWFHVTITNPQYVVGSTGSQMARNPLRTPVLHRISFSTNAQFDGSGDVRTYGPSTQTHFPVGDIGTSLRWVRLESSFDGENWNKATVSGPYQS